MQLNVSNCKILEMYCFFLVSRVTEDDDDEEEEEDDNEDNDDDDDDDSWILFCVSAELKALSELGELTQASAVLQETYRGL